MPQHGGYGPVNCATCNALIPADGEYNWPGRECVNCEKDEYQCVCCEDWLYLTAAQVNAGRVRGLLGDLGPFVCDTCANPHAFSRHYDRGWIRAVW